MTALLALLRGDLVASAFLLSTAEATRAFLRARPEVVALRAALTSGEITEADVRRFVNDLLGKFHRGTKFPGEILLAAIAAAVETLPGAFAEEYLHDLARLRIREISIAPRVARLSLSHRSNVLVGTTDRSQVISSLLSQGPREAIPHFIDSQSAETHLRLAS